MFVRPWPFYSKLGAVTLKWSKSGEKVLGVKRVNSYANMKSKVPEKVVSKEGWSLFRG